MIVHLLVFIFKLVRLKVKRIVRHLTRVVYCCKMAQAMILQQKCMEVDFDLDRIDSEMIELLDGLKSQSAYQLHQNFFQDDNKKSKKGRN